MRFEKVIKKRRKDLGISQEELANLCDMSQFRIGEIERGSDNTTWEEITKIGKQLSLNTVKSWRMIENEI